MPNDKKLDEAHVSSNLEPYLAKDGDARPYASLLTDLTFKKAFNPDVENSRKTLVAMLNDILGPQLASPIKSVRTRNVEQNASGSGVSRTAIFDLHCEDDKGELIEIEVQIRKMTNFMKRLGYYASQMVSDQGNPGDWDFEVKPSFLIAFSRYKIFDDGKAIHRLTTTDIETHKRLLDSYNYTVIELSKVPQRLPTSEEEKWLFLFRYLDRLKTVPPEMDNEKFAALLLSCKISRLNREEFQEYRKMYHAIFDHNAMREGFFEEFAEEINQKVEEAVSVATSGAALAKAREMAKRMLAKSRPPSEIAEFTGLTKEEILAL